MNFDANNPHYVRLKDVKPFIDSGFLLQFRGSSYCSSLIKLAAGVGPHSHTAMADRRANGEIDVLEMREFRGGRISTIEFQAAEYPGVIDIFAPNAGSRWPEWDGEKAANMMRTLTNRKYGYRGAARIGIRHCPFIWRFYKVETNDIINGNGKDLRPFCSHAVCLASREAGGVDPVPRLPDYLVEPGHLTNSMFYDYKYSLSPH